MIAELQTEKERLDEAIFALERLSTTNIRRRPSRGPKEEQLPDEVETETEANAE